LPLSTFHVSKNKGLNVNKQPFLTPQPLSKGLQLIPNFKQTNGLKPSKNFH